MCTWHGVNLQNLEKNYRDYQFRVTHLDPVVEPDLMHQRENSRTNAQTQKEPTTSDGKLMACVVDCWYCRTAADIILF